MEVHDSPDRLPDWLARVPMDAPKTTWIAVAEGKSVPLRTLVHALQGKIGIAYGVRSISPELAAKFAEFTENPAWKNLPSDPTHVKRVNEDTWEVRVGDFRESFTRDELMKRIKEVVEKKEQT